MTRCVQLQFVPNSKDGGHFIDGNNQIARWSHFPPEVSLLLEDDKSPIRATPVKINANPGLLPSPIGLDFKTEEIVSWREWLTNNGNPRFLAIYGQADPSPPPPSSPPPSMNDLLLLLPSPEEFAEYLKHEYKDQMYDGSIKYLTNRQQGAQIILAITQGATYVNAGQAAGVQSLSRAEERAMMVARRIRDKFERMKHTDVDSVYFDFAEFREFWTPLLQGWLLWVAQAIETKRAAEAERARRVPFKVTYASGYNGGQFHTSDGKAVTQSDLPSQVLFSLNGRNYVHAVPTTIEGADNDHGHSYSWVGLDFKLEFKTSVGLVCKSARELLSERGVDSFYLKLKL